MATPPLVVLGVGGSGTRVYRQIAEAAGYAMLGAPAPLVHLRYGGQEPHDNLLLRRIGLDRWADRSAAGGMTTSERRRAAVELKLLLALTGPLRYGRGRWGWKNPRNAYVVNVILEAFPEASVLHVVRDGRDHAFHPSFPYRKHERATLDEGERAQPDHVRKGVAWARRHELVGRARDALGDRYAVSRLEDLVADPAREVGRLVDWLGGGAPERVAEAATAVHRPDSLGRWVEADLRQIAEVEVAIGSTLRGWGYQLATA